MCQSFLSGLRRHNQFTIETEKKKDKSKTNCVHFVQMAVGSLSDKLPLDWLSIIYYI